MAASETPGSRCARAGVRDATSTTVAATAASPLPAACMCAVAGDDATTSRARSPEGGLVHGRDVGGDHLPAEVGESDPRLALAADEVLAAHLEFEIHGGDIATEGEDLETDALLLDARPGGPRHAVRVDLGEAVAVLVERIADRMRAVPERGVEHLHVLVDQRLLVALEDLTDLGHDLGPVRRRIDHQRASIARATATSVASLPWPPMIESPIGRPPTSAPGMLTWGTPVNPPCASMVVIRARSGVSVESGSPLRGAGNGVDGRQRIVPRGNSHASRARASSRICSAQCRSFSEMSAADASPRATLHCSRGLSRSSHDLKVSHASHGCSVRCARAHADSPGGAITSSRTSFTSVDSRRTIG